MSMISQLWLPILATAVFIFIASSLIHMVFKWHNSDYLKLSNEDDVRAAIRAGQPAPGQYVLPHCTDMKEIQGEAMQKKYLDGPVAFMTVKKNGPPEMTQTLSLWFVYSLVIATIAAAIAFYGLGVKADAERAALVVGVASFLGYVGGSVPLAIWMGKPWISVAKDALDGLIYATISAMTFCWLWP